MNIRPLNKKQASWFVRCIQDTLRAYPPPQQPTEQEDIPAFNECQEDHARLVSQAIINLGARHAKLELTEEMQAEVDLAKEGALILGLLTTYAGLTDKEIWLRMNPDDVVNWMIPYLSEALGLDSRRDDES